MFAWEQLNEGFVCLLMDSESNLNTMTKKRKESLIVKLLFFKYKSCESGTGELASVHFDRGDARRAHSVTDRALDCMRYQVYVRFGSQALRCFIAL